MSASLYHHAQELLALEALLLEAEGTDNAEVHAIVATWFAELEGALSDKIDATLRLMREIEVRALARKAEAQRLADRARVDAAHAERIRELVRNALELSGLRSLKTAHFDVALALAGKGKVECLAKVEDLPPDCVREKREPDLDALRERLERGEVIPNVTLLPRVMTLRLK